MNSQLEEIYLEAEADIKNNNYVEAFRKYETILMEEPGNGPTLNSLGWLSKTQIEDFEKAEAYYKASISSDPVYPHSYLNYASLLMDMERFEDLAQLLEKCFLVSTIEKSLVYTKFGLMEELRLNFKEAVVYFEKAILVSVSDEKIKDNQQHIDRCRQKIELAKNHTNWLNNAKGL
jgi:tetratricopeptide (TPR) repeat protein